MGKPKCGGCGKFLNSSEGVRCTKCPGIFHRACVGIPIESTMIGPHWNCPNCKIKIPRKDNSSTPVKGMVLNDRVQSEACRSAELATDIPENPGCISVLTSVDTSTEVSSGPCKNSSEVAEKNDADLNISLALEIRYLRNEMSALRTEVREYCKEICSVKTELRSCLEQVSNLGLRIDSLEKANSESYNKGTNILESKIEMLENKYSESHTLDKSYIEDSIAVLKPQLNARDQELLQNDIEIAGIPEKRDESLYHLTNLMSVKLGLKLSENDIVSVERVGMVRRDRPGGENAPDTVRPRNIAVRFVRRTLRDEYLQAARVRRHLTTIDLDLPGPGLRLYVNERLTKFNRQLFGKSRELGRRHDWKYIWTKQGNIFARKNETNHIERIRDESDIKRIFGSN